MNSSAVQRFLQSRDLRVLEQQPIVFDKNPKAVDAIRCGACW
jgi:hypothetical protein